MPARLPRRRELTAGLLAAAFTSTVLMMALFVTLALVWRTVEVNVADLLLILPRRPALCLLADARAAPQPPDQHPRVAIP